MTDGRTSGVMGREADPDHDAAAVATLLGREPAGHFRVVVRRTDGTPAVIENAPLLDDGTPMPTVYWLVDRALRSAVSRLEAEGGVRRAAREIEPEAIERAHDLYAAQRDALLEDLSAVPRPTGGVGGSRAGVKCLHAHLAWWLAGGADPVGEWVATRLQLDRPEDGRLK